MSSAYGLIRRQNGSVLCFIYSGTSDICDRRLYETIEEAWDHYRKSEERKKCEKCDEELVDIYTDYAEKYWQGKVCAKCKRITQGVLPHDDYMMPSDIIGEIQYGKPEWVTNFLLPKETE